MHYCKKLIYLFESGASDDELSIVPARWASTSPISSGSKDTFITSLSIRKMSWSGGFFTLMETLLTVQLIS